MTESQRLRLLLVEDDASVAEMYKLKLEHDEYVVDVASDGEAALAMVAAVAYDLIFLDIQLPKLNGFVVLEKLRARDATRHTPVVILSNLAEAEFHEHGKRLGALDFLIKSKSTPAEVSRTVDSWFRAGTGVGHRAHELA